MKMKRVLIAGLAMMLLVFAVVSCAPEATETSAAETSASAEETSAAETSASTEATKGEEITIGVSLPSKLDDLNQAIETLVKDVAAKYSAEMGRKITVIVNSADGDVAKQAANIEDYINMGVDVIMVNAQDTKVIESSVKASHDANIPFITIVRPLDPTCTEEADVFIGMDTGEMAYVAMKAVYAKMKEEGATPINLVETLGDLTDYNAVLRTEAVKKASEEDGATIVQEVPTQWNPDVALTGLTAAFQAHPEANAIWIASDFMAPAVETALKRFNRWIPCGEEGHVYFVGNDLQPAGYKAIQNNYMDATTVFDLYGILVIAVEKSVELVDNGSVDQKAINPECRVVTPENINTLEGLWSKDFID